MRLRSAPLLFLPVLLAACEPALQPGPRVDFVTSTRFNPAVRRLTTPADTVAVKVYAAAQSNDARLTRLTIKALYTPAAYPITYGPLYREKDALKSEITYLDSVINNASEFAFQSVQATRTTAGREEWSYSFRDEQQRTGVRSFFLRLARTDSAAALHTYTVPIQTTAQPDRRSFLALREGLALPKFSVRTIPGNQQLIDLVCVPTAAGQPTLATTSDTDLNLRWATPRITQIRSTALTQDAFGSTTTLAAFTAAFTTGLPFARATSTGPLRAGQVIAFLTPDDKYGLLRVESLPTTGTTAAVLQVRMGK